jgi:hypothetical protein
MGQLVSVGDSWANLTNLTPFSLKLQAGIRAALRDVDVGVHQATPAPGDTIILCWHWLSFTAVP